MTLAEEFSLLARELTEEFSVGAYAYTFIEKEYDATTGESQKDYISVRNLNAARYDHREEERTDRTFSEDVWTVVVAGYELGNVVPQIGGIVEFPDSSEHTVLAVDYDQYAAAYFIIVKKKAIKSA